MTTSPSDNRLYDLLADLQRQRDGLHKQIQDLEGKIASVQTTMRLLSGRDASNGSTSIGMSVVTLADLAGSKTQMEALKIIAKLSKGYVNATEAAKLLIQAGLAKGKKKNVVPHIWNILNKSEEFEKDSPGTFRLLAPDELASPLY